VNRLEVEAAATAAGAAAGAPGMRVDPTYLFCMSDSTRAIFVCTTTFYYDMFV